jgi:hypothetical protein
MLITSNTESNSSPGTYLSLHLWQLRVSFDPTVLMLPTTESQRVVPSSHYGEVSSNVETVSATESVLYASAIVKPGQEGLVASAEVPTCVIRFQVAATVPIGVVTPAISNARFFGMVNEASFSFLGANDEIRINNIMPQPNSNSASLRAFVGNQLIGVRAWASHRHVVMRPNGTPRESSVITVRGVRTGFRSQDTVADAATCTPQNVAGTARLQSNSCSNVQALSVPTPKAPVLVQSAGFQTTVVLRVHVAIHSRVTAAQAELRRACDVGVGMYERMLVRKMVVFWDGDATPMQEIDVTGSAYDFPVTLTINQGVATGDSAVVRYDAEISQLSGFSVGTATLSPTVPLQSGPHGLGAFQVTVSDTPQVPAFSGTSLFTYYGVTWPEEGGFPWFHDKSPLELEGDRHYVVAVATPAGTLLSALQVQHHVTTLTSDMPAVYTVTPAGGALSPHWIGEVPVGAYDTGFKGTVALRGPSTGCLFNNRPINVSMPVPVSAVLSIPGGGSGFVVAAGGGDRASELYSTTSPQMSLTVTMDTGDMVQLGGDSRTTFTAAGPLSSEVTFSASGAFTTLSGPTTDGVLTVSATAFGGLISSSNTLSVTIAAATGITIAGTKTSANGAQQSASTLLRISCSEHFYQAALFTSQLHTSNGGSKVINPLYSTSTPATLFALPDGQTFRGVNSGTTPLTGRVDASYPPFSAQFDISVSNLGAAVLTAQVGGTEGPTALGRKGDPKQLTVYLTLVDGTTIADYFSGFNGYNSADVTHAQNGLLSMASDEPASITVSPNTGAYTVEANTVDPVTLSATLRHPCANEISTFTITATANLQPEPVDVDVGQTMMAPIPPVTGPTEVPIRITSQGSSILDARVRLHYTPNALNVVSCTTNAAFQYADCTTDEVPGEILVTVIAGTPIANPSTLVGIEVATITLGAVGSGGVMVDVPLAAELVFMTTHNGPGCTEASPCSVTAGSSTPVSVSTQGARRRMLRESKQAFSEEKFERHIQDLKQHRHALHSRAVNRRQGRSLLQLSAVRGDTDASGAFDQNDIRFALEYYNNAAQLGCATACQSRSALTSDQLNALKPLNDASVPGGGREIFYLFMIFNGKSR